MDGSTIEIGVGNETTGIQIQRAVIRHWISGSFERTALDGRPL